MKALIVWAPGHCGLSGNELADHQAKLSATDTQHDNALAQATQRSLICPSCHHPPIQIQDEQLKEVFTSHPNKLIKTSFAKTERTKLARSLTMAAFGGNLRGCHLPIML